MNGYRGSRTCGPRGPINRVLRLWFFCALAATATPQMRTVQGGSLELRSTLAAPGVELFDSVRKITDSTAYPKL